jgi:phosphopentomutase
MRRAIVIVLDGCGAGAAPDAALFGDHDNPSTLSNVWNAAGPIKAPNLLRLGFFQAGQIKGLPKPDDNVLYGRLQERSMGKDSVTGHWEMMGIHTSEPFPTYPNGFPAELIKEFENRIGIKTLGNRASSGTAIISELGQHHLETGQPIVYTSADSVFQIAAHQAVIPVDRLYAICEIAREICHPPHQLQRVIARPFVGDAATGFTRTDQRKDFPALAPHNLADLVGDVLGIGVVPELFAGRGFRPSRRTQSNAEHENALKEALCSDARFIWANFEDFDMLYGHRNDAAGFARCLQDFDQTLARLLPKLGVDDLLILTSDHGNDPTTPSTDHTREYVPVSIFNPVHKGAELGDVVGMDAIGATVAAWIGVDGAIGRNLLSEQSVQ